MTCPDDDALLSVALGETPEPPHVARCAACSARLGEWRAHLDAVAAALADAGTRHDAGRRRLLDALPSIAPARPTVSGWRKGFEMVRRHWLTSSAALLVLGAAMVWLGTGPRVAFAQAGEALQKVAGVRCDMVAVVPGYNGHQNLTLAGRLWWRPDGATRVEDIGSAGDLTNTRIRFPGRPGIALWHSSKLYSPEPAEKSDNPFAVLLTQVVRFRGQADADLGTREIRGVKARGFRVGLSKVFPEEGPPGGQLEVWLDPATSLPVRTDVTEIGDARQVVRLEGFEWGPVDPAKFDATPPEGFVFHKPDLPDVDKLTGYVTTGLRVYAKYNNGRYPAVAHVYGDRHRDELRKLMDMPKDAAAGVSPESGVKWAAEKDGEFAHATFGLTWINGIQYRNEDCVYNGKSVTPADKAKVLFRWKLDDGRHRVIFGDLSAKTLTADELKGL